MKTIEKIREMKENNNLLLGEKVNPKSERMEIITPLSVIGYSNTDSIVVTEEDIKFNIASSSEEGFSISNVEEINKTLAENICRMHLPECEGKFYKVYVGNVFFVEIFLKINGRVARIRPLCFPYGDSNVAIFASGKKKLHYVYDGKVQLIEGKLYWKSSNQQVIEEFEKRFNNEEEVTFEKCMSKLLWHIDEEDFVKNISFIDEVKYLNFPRMGDGTPYNTVWLDDTKDTLYHAVLKHPNIADQIRVSSLSQNGISAQAGPIGKEVATGIYEILDVKPFFGSKGKFDVSSTQGPKTFKLAKENANNRILVCLAEIKPKNHRLAMNLMGNCIATKKAFDEYQTLLTKEKAAKARILYPAHKVFIKVNDETVRVKGATSFYEMTAELENGDIEDKIVVLPPREVNTLGVPEEDFGKFKFLVNHSTEDVQWVKLRAENMEECLVPALYCEIAEDAKHSAVYSLRTKFQNLFYYGCIKLLYSHNGFTKMANALSKMLNQSKIKTAMNIAEIIKKEEKEINF